MVCNRLCQRLFGKEVEKTKWVCVNFLNSEERGLDKTRDNLITQSNGHKKGEMWTYRRLSQK